MSNSVSEIGEALEQASKKVQGDFATVRDQVTNVLFRLRNTVEQLLTTFGANMTTGEASKNDNVTSTSMNPGE